MTEPLKPHGVERIKKSYRPCSEPKKLDTKSISSGIKGLLSVNSRR